MKWRKWTFFLYYFFNREIEILFSYISIIEQYKNWIRLWDVKRNVCYVMIETKLKAKNFDYKDFEDNFKKIDRIKKRRREKWGRLFSTFWYYCRGKWAEEFDITSFYIKRRREKKEFFDLKCNFSIYSFIFASIHL